MTPRLYSISTVCLLKHYNQDYLLHELRTDFTGSNGVGKSIIADLFQIVFVADTNHIKFATEGIDKNKRKIEKLPYESGIGFVFFNIEVKANEYLTIGTAILAQGNPTVRPFIITSSIALRGELDQHTFSSKKLLFSTNFLKPSKEPYMLDELARILPDDHELYFHSFNTKEQRSEYYDWLYKNELLPINLVKEGNLKAYAKVIQSFSKSKALNIDNSKSLIEYLFEEDEIEISKEYKQQEQTIERLLFLFKSTKTQIDDISSKQTDLRQLKEQENEKNNDAYNLDLSRYVFAHQSQVKKKMEVDRREEELSSKQNRCDMLKGQSEALQAKVNEAKYIADQKIEILSELAGKQSLFDRLAKLNKEEKALTKIDTNGLMQEVNTVPPARISELLLKDAWFYEEKIESSRGVLKRYSSVDRMEKKREEQESWLKKSIRQIEEKESKLVSFAKTLENVEQNSLFAQTLSSNKNITSAQQAVLVHLRDVLIRKPEVASEGVRYADSVHLINNLSLTEDTNNKGWWMKTGDLYEFVPETSTLFPDLSSLSFTNIDEVRAYLIKEMDSIKRKKEAFIQLQKGTITEGFTKEDFDVDLSDPTKASNHRVAAELCAIVNHKIAEVKKLQLQEKAEIEEMESQYGISLKGVTYDQLLEETRVQQKAYQSNFESLNHNLSEHRSEITGLESSLPYLREEHKKASQELEDLKIKFDEAEDHFQSNHPDQQVPDFNIHSYSAQEIGRLDSLYADSSAKYINKYNQLVGKFEETKDQRELRVNEQISNRTFSFDVLEQALLGKKIRTLDQVTDHLDRLNIELLAIADDLLESLVKVFGKTESYYDRYREQINDLNDFFKGKLISNRFYFRIEFDKTPKLDIRWIEQLRKSTLGMSETKVSGDITPEQFISDFYMKYSGNKTRVEIDDLLNPKRYFVLKGRLTDKNGRDIPGSTGESYTAVALLGIARLSIVQDGNRPGLRFIILEESATLDSVNFGLFPTIAKEYGYQIITMTPKPYAIGDDDGWFIHHLIPGKENEDINYSKTMSFFRTNSDQMELANYLKARQQ